jgi:hypothetical protein
MGAATRHRRAFLAKHRYCAFCGGHATATTVEHCPPRALFQDRRWPESFEFPCCLLLHWFSNELLVTKGEYPQLELLKDLGGHAPALSRSGKFLNDQFAYKLTTTPEKNIFIIQAVFGKSFGLVIVGSKQAGALEAMTQRFRDEGLGAGPFAVLQSSVLTIADDFGFATSKRTKVRADRS